MRGLLRSRAARMGAVTVLGAATVAVAAGCGQSVDNGNVNLIAGKQVFVSKCGSCHTLAHASTKGTVGPNLDDAFRGALRDGFKRSTVRGVVQHQILYPASNGPMPAKLVTGKTAENVAAYVATVAAAPGSDKGLLASAVKKAGAGKPAVEKAGTLQIDADPTGQLAYVTNRATATAGNITLKMQNKSGTPHNLAVKGNGLAAKGTPIVSGGKTASVQVSLKPGTYTFFCEVDGHAAAGMKGTLVVK